MGGALRCAGRHQKLLRTAKLAALCVHERQAAELRVAVEMCAMHTCDSCSQRECAA